MKKFTFIPILVFLLSSCDPFHTKIEDQDLTVSYYEADTKKTNIPTPTTLNIVTWNVKFGGARIDFFFDCHGNRVLMTEAEVLDNMAGISTKIRNMDPDIIFLQEVDIDSKRSGYVDQVAYILNHTNLNYAVYAPQWLADYVPSDGIGQMNSGNAILSKYPLNNAERVALPLIEEQSTIVQYFYLRRNIITAEVSVATNDIVVLGTHTTAYSTDDTKKIQLELIKSKVAGIDASGKDFILGGDFNNVPPGTIKYCDFDDNACSEDSPYYPLPCSTLVNDLETMKIYAEYDAAIPQDLYMLNQDLYTSYTSDKNGFWNRKLDYIFTNGDFIANTGKVHQGITSGEMATMPLSDHAPISTIYQLK